MASYENGQEHAQEQQRKLAAGAEFGILPDEVVSPEQAMEYVASAEERLREDGERSGIDISRISCDFWRGYLSRWD